MTERTGGQMAMRKSLGSLLVGVCALAGCSTLLRAGPAPDTGLAAELDAIFADSSVAHAHWGVLVRTADDGATLYARNAERLFVPASNVKILTGAAALETLGPDYRYRTTISTSGAVANGILNGSLIVTGTGDPTLSERFYDDSRAVFRAWADSLRAYGVQRISGNIVAVDTAFAGPPIGSGWMWDDLLSGTSAEYGALQFNDGVLGIDLFPSQTQLQPALVVLSPPTQAVPIINDTRTVPAGSLTNIRISRDELGTGIVVQGEVAQDSDGVTRTVAVHGLSNYYATVVRETLREAGIQVEGQAVHYAALEEYDPTLPIATPLFTHDSPPLREILPEMLKPSQNMIAETLLMTVGREMRGESTARGGAAVLDSLFTAWEIQPRQLRLADGSGLSRYNLASPALLMGVLEHMDRSAHREVWLESLPIGGRDGTLENRMRDPPLLDNVRAKTGTLSNVRALSGYLTTQSGRRVMFSILLNNYMVGAAAADRLVEDALTRIWSSPL